jgi:hypothetical protein
MAKKAKAARLLDTIHAMPPASKPIRDTWVERLKANDPDGYAQIVEVIEDFNANGNTKKVFPNAARLYEFLIGKDPERPGPNRIGDIGDVMFRRFVRSLRKP